MDSHLVGVIQPSCGRAGGRNAIAGGTIMTQGKDWASSEISQGDAKSQMARKVLTYAVRQVGAAWPWEVRLDGSLIDRGIANSAVNARVAALSVGMKLPQSAEAL